MPNTPAPKAPIAAANVPLERMRSRHMMRLRALDSLMLIMASVDRDLGAQLLDLVRDLLHLKRGGGVRTQARMWLSNPDLEGVRTRTQTHIHTFIHTHRCVFVVELLQTQERTQ